MLLGIPEGRHNAAHRGTWMIHVIYLKKIPDVIANRRGLAKQVFAFYHGRGKCEKRIEELQNGFAADGLSCHRFRPMPFACCCLRRHTIWSCCSGIICPNACSTRKWKPCAVRVLFFVALSG